MSLFNRPRCALSTTGLRPLTLIAGWSALLASVALTGCSDDDSKSKLSALRESCTGTADCEAGLSCVKQTCVVDPDATPDTHASVDAGATGDVDELDTAKATLNSCTKVCIYYGTIGACEQFGAVTAKGSCYSSGGKKQICCDFDKAPACDAPFQCLGPKDKSCAMQGGKQVAGWCGTADKTCCDLNAKKACPAPATCFKGSLKECYTQGGSLVTGACDGDNEICCAFKPCEAPFECVDSAVCEASGEAVGYACATYPTLCCDKSGGSSPDAGADSEDAGEDGGEDGGDAK